MAEFPQTIKIKSELEEKTHKLSLSCDHLTTMNFGEPNVVYYRHNTPREKFEADIAVFARPFPMQQPLMGKAKHKLSMFYVPFRVISPQWNAFITKEPYVPANGSTAIQVSEMPYFTTKTLADFLVDTDISTIVTSGAYDYEMNATQYKLTPLGRYSVKILEQLGYQMICDDKGLQHIDAMGLLAFAKVYLDFYFTNQYAKSWSNYVDVEQLFKKDNTTTYEVTAADIKKIMQICRYCCYDSDMWVSAWDNPSAPNTFNDVGAITITDITYKPNTYNNVTNNNPEGNGTPILTANNSSSQVRPITQYALDALKKMTDYCVRYAMSGVYAVDRYLARFGVLLSSEKMKRSIYYGTQETQMQFGAIYSTADTTNAKVGDYAGQGIINSDDGEHKHFEVDSDEYGIILAIGSIIPKVGYYQGIDRNNLHHEAETYFNGIFDQLGTAAISASEVYCSTNMDSGLSRDAQILGLFGYLPRTYEYKIARDRLTGDFTKKSLNAYAGAWHLFREFNDNSWSLGFTRHNIDFCQMIDAGQYLRIFNNTNEEDGDHFNVVYQIKAQAMAHCKPLYEAYDFESEGKELLMNTMGPKQN